MASIAFNSDIAPLRSQFFPVGGLRQSEFAQLQAIDQQIQPMRDQQMKLVNNMLNLQQQELAFERSQLALDSARRKAKMEVDAMGMLPEISSRLEGISSDDSKDSFQKSKEIAQEKMRYANVLQFSPALQDLFSSASSVVQADGNRERQKQAEERRAQGAIYQIAQVGGDVDPFITDPSSEGGVNITPNERAFQGLSSEMQKRQTKSEEAAAAKIKRSLEDQQIAARRSRLEDFDKTLKGLKVIDADDDFIVGSLKGGETKMPEIVDRSLDYDARSRQQIEEIMRQLNPALDMEFIQKASNEDLTRAAIRTINNELNALSPTLTAPPSPAASAIGTAFST